MDKTDADNWAFYRRRLCQLLVEHYYHDTFSLMRTSRYIRSMQLELLPDGELPNDRVSVSEGPFPFDTTHSLTRGGLANMARYIETLKTLD